LNDVLNAFAELYGADGSFNIEYHGDSDEISEFMNYTENGICKGEDNPDAYFLLNDNLLIIEHFKIDCSKKTRKGSLSLKDIARTDREFSEMLNDPNRNIYHSTITAPTSYNYFIKNSIETFSTHYKKIDTYIKNIKKQENILEFRSIRVCFVVEDVSIIPPTVIMDGKMTGILLTNCEEFLIHFKKCRNVDWLLYLPSDNNQRTTEPKGFFCSQKYIDKYFEHTVPYKNMRFISEQPDVAGGKITFIPSHNK
jgi:hypothetical protein